jgi:hypothetical protein
MLARFLKFISHNQLAATIVGTIIGGWILAQLLAMKAPDVGGVLGAVGAWLRGPAGSTRVDEITAVLLAILLGFVAGGVLFMRQHPELFRRKEQAPPAAAPAPPRVIPDDFTPTERQGWETGVLMHYWPSRVDLEQLFRFVQQAFTREGNDPHLLLKAHVARDMEQLEAIGMVRIDALGQVRYYHLTTAGRDWLLEGLPKG